MTDFRSRCLMRMRRFCFLPVLILLALVCTSAGGQSGVQTSASLSYDVVSIKVSHALNFNNQSMTMLDTTLTMENIAMKTLIKNAYGIREGLITGLPAWTNSSRYDISAKVIDGDPKLYKDLTQAQRRTLIANLLADRFSLKAHIEDKMLPMYELVLAKDGPSFKESAPLPPADPGKPMEKEEGRVSSSQRHFDGEGVKMSRLSGDLEEVVDRNVFDMTGLKGRYDLHLRWTPNDAPTAALSDTSDPPPNIFTALQEQLGLKLVPAKGPVPTLVIDRIERPTEN